MLWSRDSCKHVIIYDGTDISWTGIEGPEDVKFKVSLLQIMKYMLQAAVDIAQMYDIFQYSSCQKSLRVLLRELNFCSKLIEMRLLKRRPSDKIEQALADWILIFVQRKNRQEDLHMICVESRSR